MLAGLLFMLPVVVVDVAGDRLDPEHTRKLVAHELGVEAVAPDDARAAEATSRIEVTGDAKTGKLTVRHRKVDEPIERSVPLHSDSARAEIDAAYLAGNLARDEAAELTPSPPRKPAEPARETAAPSSEDDRRYAQLRAYVLDLSDDARATSFRSGVLLATSGALLLAPGIYIGASGGFDNPSDAGLATASFVMGGVFMGVGLVAMIARNDPYEPLAKVVREQDAKKASPADAIANVESEWKSQIASEHTVQRTSAILSFVLAGASLGIGTTLLATGTDLSSGTIAFMLATAGVNVLTGVASLVFEGPMERAHRQWQAVSTAKSPTVGLGIAPTVGGGAASVALTF